MHFIIDPQNRRLASDYISGDAFRNLMLLFFPLNEKGKIIWELVMNLPFHLYYFLQRYVIKAITSFRIFRQINLFIWNRQKQKCSMNRFVNQAFNECWTKYKWWILELCRDLIELDIHVVANLTLKSWLVMLFCNSKQKLSSIYLLNNDLKQLMCICVIRSWIICVHRNIRSSNNYH